MTLHSSHRTLLALAASGIAVSLTLSGCAAGSGSTEDGPVELSALVDNTESSVGTLQVLVDAFEAQNPDITIDIETRPGGDEGNNIVNTRLATGEMNDIFWFNSGSLLQALSPDQTILKKVASKSAWSLGRTPLVACRC